MLTLTYCSSDNNGSSPSSSSSVKPTKIVTTYSGSTQVSTSTFTYNGNKIVEQLIVPSDNVSKFKYTYTGENITKIEAFSGTTFDLNNTTTFTYENNKIKTKIKQGIAPYPYIKTIYVHNTDETITTTSINIDQTTGIETPNAGSYKSYFTNGNLTKTENIDDNGTVNKTTYFTYEIGKFNAFKNVIGLDKIGSVGNNNLTSLTFSGSNPVLTTYTSTYNTSNYPIQIESTTSSPTATLTQTQIITY